MTRLTGPKKISTAVFISGSGTNLKNLIKFSNTKNSPIVINLVVSDNSKAKGLKFATKFKIKKKIINYKIKKMAEKKILYILKKNNINFICLAGFMKILSNNFIKSFKHQIVNIHPSLLPKYKGLNTHERAIKNKEKFSGCTVHYVSSKLDSGKIISQKRINISKIDTPISLAKKVLKKEHVLYPLAILKIFN